MEIAIDTIILGCTHYPLIKNEVQGLLKDVGVVDSADTTTVAVRRVLMRHDDFAQSDGARISGFFS
jgi:glutamate racemase